jgi:hypothetical protein
VSSTRGPRLALVVVQLQLHNVVGIIVPMLSGQAFLRRG